MIKQEILFYLINLGEAVQSPLSLHNYCLDHTILCNCSIFSYHDFVYHVIYSFSLSIEKGFCKTKISVYSVSYFTLSRNFPRSFSLYFERALNVCWQDILASWYFHKDIWMKKEIVIYYFVCSSSVTTTFESSSRFIHIDTEELHPFSIKI